VTETEEDSEKSEADEEKILIGKTSRQRDAVS